MSDLSQYFRNAFRAVELAREEGLISEDSADEITSRIADVASYLEQQATQQQLAIRDAVPLARARRGLARVLSLPQYREVHGV